MNIQSSINQGLSIASMLYTQTDKYQGQQEFKHEQRERKIKERQRLTGAPGNYTGQEQEAVSRYVLTGPGLFRQNERKAMRAAHADYTRTASADTTALQHMENYEIDIPATGSVGRQIREFARLSGMSRGKAATIVRQAQREKDPRWQQYADRYRTAYQESQGGNPNGEE